MNRTYSSLWSILLTSSTELYYARVYYGIIEYAILRYYVLKKFQHRKTHINDGREFALKCYLKTFSINLLKKLLPKITRLLQSEQNVKFKKFFDELELITTLTFHSHPKSSHATRFVLWLPFANYCNEFLHHCYEIVEYANDAYVWLHHDCAV